MSSGRKLPQRNRGGLMYGRMSLREGGDWEGEGGAVGGDGGALKRRAGEVLALEGWATGRARSGEGNCDSQMSKGY